MRVPLFRRGWSGVRLGRYTAFAVPAYLVATAGAAVISTGTYQLHDHPDAAQDPPPDALRLNELVDVTSGNDVFTMSFDATGSDMKLDYDGSSIHIYGIAYGGRDVGGTYAADAYLGFYDIDFWYTVGVGPAGADDDIDVVAPSDSNSGTVITPYGPTITLLDKSNGDYTFRLGDEDNDLGHRGFPGISGWGWVEIDGALNPSATRDWLFTADFVIPTPGALSLLAPLALVPFRHRR